MSIHLVVCSFGDPRTARGVSEARSLEVSSLVAKGRLSGRAAPLHAGSLFVTASPLPVVPGSRWSSAEATSIARYPRSRRTRPQHSAASAGRSGEPPQDGCPRGQTDTDCQTIVRIAPRGKRRHFEVGAGYRRLSLLLALCRASGETSGDALAAEHTLAHRRSSGWRRGHGRRGRERRHHHRWRGRRDLRSPQLGGSRVNRLGLGCDVGRGMRTLGGGERTRHRVRCRCRCRMRNGRRGLRRRCRRWRERLRENSGRGGRYR